MMKYRDLEGNEFVYETRQDILLANIYNSCLGRNVLNFITKPAISRLGGALLNTRISKLLIKPFISKNHIDMDEYVKTNYKSYNDFFTRHIALGARHVDYSPEHFISPCDGKVSVYDINSDSIFKIKNSYYTVESMLRSKKLAEKYANGSCVIIRLTVDNYHRYCYLDNGIKSKNYFINGCLHTVNPVALKHVNVYKENSREYTLMKTENFGTVVQVEVGALMVGKISNHMEQGTIYKGYEKGMFEFGGSTIVLFVQNNKVDFNENLIKNTDEGYETLIKMGDCIGNAKK